MKKILVALLFALSLINIPVFAEMVKVKKEVKNFDTISLQYPGVVHLKQGDTESLTIEAKDNTVIEKIDIKVSRNTLVIKSNKKWFSVDSSEKVNFYITMKNVKKILSGGSNAINIETPIKTDDLTIKISGNGSLKSTEDFTVHNELSLNCSGNIELGLRKLTVSSLDININGSGDIKILEGNVNKQKIIISGSGNYIAPELESKESDISCYGSGKLEINATEILKAKISGSGNVTYYGNPKEIEQKIFGNGTIKKSSK